MACSWYLILFFSLLLVLLGLYTHWSVSIIGALLPLIPMLSLVLQRRLERRTKNQPPD